MDFIIAKVKIRRLRCSKCHCTSANFNRWKKCGLCKIAAWEHVTIEWYPFDVKVDQGLVN